LFNPPADIGQQQTSQLDASLLSLEVVMRLDMVRRVHKNETWMCASVARRERLPVYAGDLMFLRVLGIVNYLVDARMRNLLSGLEYVSNVSHSSPLRGKRIRSGDRLA
jgi:hypothetical protein